MPLPCHAVRIYAAKRAAGWVVRKQLGRALRQEGAVLAAIIHLMTAEDPTQAPPPFVDAEAPPLPQQQQQQQRRRPPRPSAAASALWQGTLSRMSLGGAAMSGKAWSVAAQTRAARAMGIHPDLFDSVEPVYQRSGPAAISMQVRRVRMS